MTRSIVGSRLILAVAAALWATPALAQAVGGYQITDLGTPGPGFDRSTGAGVNDQSQATGFAQFASGGQTRAFFWAQGTMQDLGTLLGDDHSFGTAINNLGHVVGESRAGFTLFRAFLFKNGAMQDLGSLGGTFSMAHDVNDLDQVVGLSTNASGRQRAFLYKDGLMQDLGTLGDTDSRALGINNKGQVVGQSFNLTTSQGHAFLLTPLDTDGDGTPDTWFQDADGDGANDLMLDLGTLLPTDDVSAAFDVNELGHVAGDSSQVGVTAPRAFLFKNGVMQDLGTLVAGAGSRATALNDQGQVVGISAGTAFLWENGTMTDLNLLLPAGSGWMLTAEAPDINNLGEIVGAGFHNGLKRGFLLSSPRRPVLVVPGIAGTLGKGTFFQSGTFGGDLEIFLFRRGIPPEELQIDPLVRVYDDLIQTLENVGYVKGKDLFPVPYDWRLPPGPSPAPGSGFDGVVSGLSAIPLSDQSFDFAVDYLGEALKRAAEAWLTNNGAPLDAVDVIAHSTGGLVARTYIQSPAYGEEYQAGRRLPKIRNLILVGVPNRGASKAWNPLNDNWGADVAYRVVLSKLLLQAWEKVLDGGAIDGPPEPITLATVTNPLTGEPDPIRFINLYVPTIRSLLATYEFLDTGGGGLSTVNNDFERRNDLVLDLNVGMDLTTPVDPFPFADQTTTTVIYGTNVSTPTTVRRRTDPAEDVLLPFTDFFFNDFTPADAAQGKAWFEDVQAPLNGDGTVPLDSSAFLFVGDPRISLRAFTQGQNTPEKVGHVELMFNKDVQKEILKVLAVPFTDDQISTGLNNGPAWAGFLSQNVLVGGSPIGALVSVILDPVDGFLIDGQGRRLGFSAATGPLAEIPGSSWFGARNGIGFVAGPIEEPLRLELTGIGEEYFVHVSVESNGEVRGVVDRGFLAAGATRTLVPGEPVPPRGAPGPGRPPRLGGGGGCALGGEDAAGAPHALLVFAVAMAALLLVRRRRRAGA